MLGGTSYCLLRKVINCKGHLVVVLTVPVSTVPALGVTLLALAGWAALCPLTWVSRSPSVHEAGGRRVKRDGPSIPAQYRVGLRALRPFLLLE